MLLTILALAIAIGNIVNVSASALAGMINAMRIRNERTRADATGSATYLLAAILSVLLPATGTCQQPVPSTSPDSPFTINVSVDEVVLHVTVRNHKGTPVAGLGRENFQIFEDQVSQPIKHFSHEDVPVTVGIVIDNSGSMRPKRAEVITAALAFADSSNPQDQMFLVNFNERVSFGLPRGTPFTDQRDQLRVAMETVIANGKTALYDAVVVALERLRDGNRDKKVLIVVSDGADNASTHTKAQMLAQAAQSNTIIYTLAIYEPDDPDNRDPHTLEELAKASGGEAYLPRELREVRPVCERIAHEIRNQYTITYIPSNQKLDGTFRTILVKAASPQGRGLAVTTRAGYFAPKKQTAAPKPEARN